MIYGTAVLSLVHPTSTYLMKQNRFHPPLDEGGHQGQPLQKFPHPSPLPEGEGIRGLIFPAGPVEKRPAMLDKKYTLTG